MTMMMVTLKPWIQREKNLASRCFAGHVIAQTAKAVCFKGRVAVRESVNCLRCGRPLTNPTSRLVGYGPDCCEHMGIDRPDFDRMTAQQLDDLRRGLKNITVEMWLPLSQIVEAVDTKLVPLDINNLPVTRPTTGGPTPLTAPRPVVVTDRPAVAPTAYRSTPARRTSVMQTIARIHDTPALPTNYTAIPGDPTWSGDGMKPCQHF